MRGAPCTIVWSVLTTGGRDEELSRAIGSVMPHPVVVLANGVDMSATPMREKVTVLHEPFNLGVPGGRHRLASSVEADIVAFLDDDAVAGVDISDRILDAFDREPRLGAVALRIVDGDGESARRHVPRFGHHDPLRGGEVALFLGGACAVRRAAYDDAGGYWTELFYGHEEVELAWRLIDRGWSIRYLPDAPVYHPRTDISRHPEGWRMTGRNRVMIARRTLPWSIAICHVLAWLLLGVARAPDRSNRAAYVRGWAEGWRRSIDRRPISWRGVWRLTRLGRPPLL